MMEKTLLKSFIDSKREKYKEPQRIGTPKGERIGLSSQKYHATLLLLTNKRQDVISEEVNASHGVIRKWNTEDEFKRTVEEHSKEFAKLFTKQLREKAENYYSDHRNMLIQYTQDEHDIMDNLQGEEFEEINKYSAQLLDSIGEEFTKAFKTIEDVTLQGLFAGILLRAIEKAEPNLIPRSHLAKFRRDIMKETKNEILEKVSKMILNSHEETSEQARHGQVYSLALLKVLWE